LPPIRIIIALLTSITDFAEAGSKNSKFRRILCGEKYSELENFMTDHADEIGPIP
jgi:hypothetical protein